MARSVSAPVLGRPKWPDVHHRAAKVLEVGSVVCSPSAMLLAEFSNVPVSIEVARRNRQSALASRNTSSRSAAVSGVKPAVMAASKSLQSSASSSVPITVSAERAWRTALRREGCFPVSMKGPVLLLALRRLASTRLLSRDARHRQAPEMMRHRVRPWVQRAFPP
jgi:hypothetical protein